MKPDARVVVVAPNWLGDAVMSLAALADVREAFAAGTLAVAARASVAPLFALVHGVDEVLTLGAGWSSLTANAETLAPGRFDLAILFPNSFASAWMTHRAGIPERWGYRADWRSRWLTRAVPRPSGGHQVAYYRDLVRALGIAPVREPLSIVVADREKAAARARLGDLGWDGASPLVGIAPGAAYGKAKQWPPDYFASLVADLLSPLSPQSSSAPQQPSAPQQSSVAQGFPPPSKSGGRAVALAKAGSPAPAAHDVATILLVGTTADAMTGRAIERPLTDPRSPAPGRQPPAPGPRLPAPGSRIPAPGPRPPDPARAAIVNLIGRTDLPTLAATMTLCRAFVSNDSGAMHLAAALGVPVTAIFGPTNERETAPRAAPGGPAPRILTHDVFCRPCMLRECPIDHGCMRGIDPTTVARACRESLQA